MDETIDPSPAFDETMRATIEARPRATVVARRTGIGARAWVAARSVTHDPKGIIVGETIGAGGMGIVHVATQTTLGRRVAVKTLRSEHRDRSNAESLLAEAWLAGSLEHPNIVPVHEVRLDSTGSPQLVMKRIEGETWSSKLERGQSVEDAVRVLEQVCNAIHFANARGIVHRDVKPDNVMVGTFGEVYVVDWGIATDADEVAAFAGTLPYAAPEMVHQPAKLTARTDVYLLGSVLFQILAGEPPHLAPSFPEMLRKVIASSPAIPDGAPAELAALVRACMAKEPHARPASALAVRLALERFLEHRGSMTLALEADRRLQELAALLTAGGATPERVYDVYGQCRFGFAQALVAWPENDLARRGLRAAVATMVDAALLHDDTRAATLLLKDLSEPDEALAERVTLASARAERRLARLSEMERRHDPTVGQGPRFAVFAFMGVVWVIGPLVSGFMGLGSSRYEVLSGLPIAALLIAFIAFSHQAWPRWRSEINARVARVVVVAMVVMVGLSIAAYAMGVPGPTFVVFKLGFWAIVVAIAAAAIEPRMLPSAAGFVVAIVATRHWIEHRYLVNSVVNGAFALNSVLVWRRSPKPPASAPG